MRNMRFIIWIKEDERMKKKYTFNELLIEMENRGCNCADVALGRMMDGIEEDTGRWPDWGDIAPDWVVKACGL
jgi:hypothetical protein